MLVRPGDYRRHETLMGGIQARRIQKCSRGQALQKRLCSRDFQGAIVALLYVGPELGSLFCKKHKALLSHVTRLWGRNVDFAGLKLEEIHLLMLSTFCFFFF